MKLSIVFSTVVLAAVYAGGCSSKSSDGAGDQTSADGTDPDKNGTDDSFDDAKEDEDEPHTGGTITFDESHGALSSESIVNITAAFHPTPKATTECGQVGKPPAPKKIDGCVFPPESTAGTYVQPVCDEDCGNSYCVYDTSCKPKCYEACTKVCEDGEVCAFNAKGVQTCQAIPTGPALEDFSAGAISFSGETGAVTIRPPYTTEHTTAGIGFIPESEVKVSASGASEVGLDAFKASFTTTTMLETSLKKLTVKDLYATTPIKVTWAKGADDLQIVVGTGDHSNTRAQTTCQADDTSGTFTLTRKVLNELARRAASADESAPKLSGLSIQLKRAKKNVQKGISTKGKLPGYTIDPDAWVSLVSTSTETVAVKGCDASQTYCPEKSGYCASLESDETNCGECGYACPSGTYCTSGVCK